MLRIAIAKGRLMDSLINYLDVIEYTKLSETLKKSRTPIVVSCSNLNAFS